MKAIRFLVLCFLMAMPAAAECLFQDGSAYWFHERWSGVKTLREGRGEREWVPEGGPLCFRTPVDQIDDAELRVRGYRQAVEEAFKLLPHDARRWNTADAVAGRQKIAALLGRDFESLEELTAWWRENAARLRWSEEKQQLVVDAAAAPAPAAAEVELTARDYWQYEAMRKLREVTDDGLSIRGLAAPGDLDGPAEVRFVVAKSVLADRAAKEDGYKRAVTALIEILATPALPPALARRTRAQLTRLTGRTFADAGGWAGWWSARRASARLDEGGTRLIAE